MDMRFNERFTMFCMYAWMLLSVLPFCNAKIELDVKWHDYGKTVLERESEVFNPSTFLSDVNQRNSETSKDVHAIIRRNVGVHSVINERLQDHDQAPIDRNITRNEDTEKQKARITVVVSCSLMMITTAIFGVFIFLRVKSKRKTKVGVLDSSSVDSSTIQP